VFLREAIGGCLLGVVLVCVAGCDGALEERASKTMSRTNNATDSGGKAKMEKAMFGAGCFWGVEAAFRQAKGVADTAAGYSGGTLEKPTYKDVCGRKTGHAEVVEVTFDPSVVTYEQLLDVFWKCHNPTQVNRQGPDVGAQYRSAIFYHTPEQQAAAVASKEKLEKSGAHKKPIATEITPASTFWRAEEYHQRYLEKQGGGSCHIPADE